MKRSAGSAHHPLAPVSDTLLQPDADRQHDSKRRKQRQNANDDDELLIFGYEARIFNDCETAVKVDKGHYLIPWQSSDSQYMMDRYDVRHMLEDLGQLSKQEFRQQPKVEESYNQERYKDLDSEEEMLFDMSEDERDAHVEEKKREREKKKEEAKFHAYEYEKKKEANQRSSAQDEIAAQYKAPSDMVVPASREQAEIIADTAKAAAASANSNLYEIKTHARQANNPLYAFLSKRHELYAFYKHLSWLLSSGLGAYGDSDSDSSSDQEDEPQKPKIDDETSNAIEKTARFVARSGPELEQKIRQRHSHDPKFAFLNRHHQYHTYYQSKVTYFRSNPNA